MFTGIVEEIGKLISTQSDSMTFRAGTVIQSLAIGGSIAVNGVCLTATKINGGTFMVDIMPETREKSNLGSLSSGDPVNLETPLTINKPIGGHFVQGHIDTTGKIAGIIKIRGATLITLTAPAEVTKYIVNKGFICVDGVSLTVAEKLTDGFSVSIVNHTLISTTLGLSRVGELVNLEVDILAKYIEQFSMKKDNNITAEFLFEHGFSVD